MGYSKWALGEIHFEHRPKIARPTKQYHCVPKTPGGAIANLLLLYFSLLYFTVFPLLYTNLREIRCIIRDFIRPYRNLKAFIALYSSFTLFTLLRLLYFTDFTLLYSFYFTLFTHFTLLYSFTPNLQLRETYSHTPHLGPRDAEGPPRNCNNTPHASARHHDNWRHPHL